MLWKYDHENEHFRRNEILSFQGVRLSTSRLKLPISKIIYKKIYFSFISTTFFLLTSMTFLNIDFQKLAFPHRDVTINLQIGYTV